MEGVHLIKVMYVVSNLVDAGPTRQLLYLLKNIDRQRIQPVILKLSSEVTDSMENEFSAIGIKIINLNSKIRRPLFKKFKLMKKIVNEERPQIIHTFGYRSVYYVSRLKLAECKRIAAFRDHPREELILTFGKIIGTFFSWHYTKLSEKMDALTSCSYTLQERLLKEMGVVSTAIPNGVDQERFFPLNMKKDLRNKLLLPIDKTIFISVGRIVPLKNYDFLCRMWNECIHESLLVIIGDGPMLDTLKEKYKTSHSRILFLGKKNNIEEYLNAADYYVSSSLTEGLPNSVLEALAVGLPVLLSDIPSHKELFDNGYDIGCLYKNNNSEDFVNKYHALLEKNYSDLSENSLKVVSKYYSVRRNAEEYEKLYFELVGNVSKEH